MENMQQTRRCWSGWPAMKCSQRWKVETEILRSHRTIPLLEKQICWETCPASRDDNGKSISDLVRLAENRLSYQQFVSGARPRSLIGCDTVTVLTVWFGYHNNQSRKMQLGPCASRATARAIMTPRRGCFAGSAGCRSRHINKRDCKWSKNIHKMQTRKQSPCADSVQNLRSSRTALLAHHSSTIIDVAMCSFRLSVPAVWNPLPGTLLGNLQFWVHCHFKSRLKTHHCPAYTQQTRMTRVRRWEIVMR